MLNLFLNRNIVLACLSDCPADNHSRPFALFLYETLCTIMTNPSKIIIPLLILTMVFSCKQKQEEKPTKMPEFIVQDKKPEFEYYDAEFKLDSISNLRTNGYYEVTQIFGTYTTDLETYHTNKPKYGFVHFFKDGFCRVGSWNGIRKNPDDVKLAFKNDKGYVFNGMYKIELDTIRIEYLYNPASPGAGQRNNRNTLTGLIRENRIDFLYDGPTRFSFPTNQSDSLSSSCIGRFRKAEFNKSKWNNYLKDNIDKYTKKE